METEYKHIYFMLTVKKPKTDVWTCVNHSAGEILGIVEWYPPWRKYCYFSHGAEVYSPGCLNDIRVFINQVQNLHLKKREEEKKKRINEKLT